MSEREHPDAYPKAQAAIDGLDDINKVVALVRLALLLNNGNEHFDHNDERGYSHLCLRCAREGSGGLNGWVGALRMMNAVAEQQGDPFDAAAFDAEERAEAEDIAARQAWFAEHPEEREKEAASIARHLADPYQRTDVP